MAVNFEVGVIDKNHKPLIKSRMDSKDFYRQLNNFAGHLPTQIIQKSGHTGRHLSDLT